MAVLSVVPLFTQSVITFFSLYRGQRYIIIKYNYIIIIFVELLKATGSLTPKVFMSDDAPAFWNAWIKIMSPISKFHLLCKCHIDNNWRKNFKKNGGSLTTKAYVYKTLHVLLDESNITEFENLFSSFLCKLEEEPAMHNYRAYEKKNQRLDALLWHLLKLTSFCSTN
ncbi:MULE domain-containing protein [Aphis craccivora]|uniref:MULE domain-containing protein n=1 Tax=Aphis craccivora TaxID=307492 RepID=A0A6G0Y778_APHCR|nr:MULE domain-containing protein [Aphis craccivora]